MNWARDPSGRFPQRPYYPQDEVDYICEQLVVDYLNEQYCKIDYPLKTEDLKVLLDQKVSDLDVYADLSSEGEDVEGMTDFFTARKPIVRISKTLTEDPYRENRLRTTLTHELGHVALHSCLTSLTGQQSLFQTTDRDSRLVIRCKRSSILLPVSKAVDWMEWQAGFASGALLMPQTELKQVVADFRESSGYFGPIYDNQTHALALLGSVQSKFQVSKQAARVRLGQLKLVEK